MWSGSDGIPKYGVPEGVPCSEPAWTPHAHQTIQGARRQGPRFPAAKDIFLSAGSVVLLQTPQIERG